ncbi:MAG: tandem-95 repeat protein [Marinilabiliales bacterium]|nr:tandem-95 repeat protein [Marinilabiliales bacterium]
MTFTPTANYAGPASFTYTVTSGGVTETATVTVTVTPVNDGASVVTSGNSGSGAEDTEITGTLVVTDPDGLAASPFSVTTLPTNGTATLDATTGVWTYTPNKDWNGNDSFTVTVTDAQGFTSTQVINVTVSPVADITDDSLTTAEDTALSFNPVTGSNGATADSFDGPTPQITAINGTPITAGGTPIAVAQGTVSLGSDNVLTFTPTANYAGPASFTYTVTSGGVTETATVTVTVTPVNDGASVVTSGNSGGGAEDTEITGTLVATDPDGLAASPFGVTTLPTNGTATLDATTGVWTYTPNKDWNGNDSFTVTVTDAQGFTSTQVINVTVTPVADITDDSLTTAEDTALSFNPVTGSNGATADSFDGPTPQITAINGTPITAGGTPIAVAQGTVSLGSDNVLTFTPTANYAGPASFTYTVTSGGVTETATVTVTVTPVNDGASVVTSGNSGSGAEDTEITGTLVVTDPDGLAASPFSVTTLPTNGTATLDATTGVWTYTPNKDWNGNDSFTVTVTDAQGFTSTQVINVTVSPVADITDDSLTTAEDAALSFNPVTGSNGA